MLLNGEVTTSNTLKLASRLLVATEAVSEGLVAFLRLLLRTVAVLWSKALTCPFGTACAVESRVLFSCLRCSKMALNLCRNQSVCLSGVPAVFLMFDTTMAMLMLLKSLKATVVMATLAGELEKEGALEVILGAALLLEQNLSINDSQRQMLASKFSQLVSQVALCATEAQLPELGFHSGLQPPYLPEEQLSKKFFSGGRCLSARYAGCLLGVLASCTHDSSVCSVLNVLRSLASCCCTSVSAILKSVLQPYPHVGFAAGQSLLLFAKQIVLQLPVQHPYYLLVVSPVDTPRGLLEADDEDAVDGAIATEDVHHSQQVVSPVDWLDSLEPYLRALRECSSNEALGLLRHFSNVGKEGHGLLCHHLLTEVVIPQLLASRKEGKSASNDGTSDQATDQEDGFLVLQACLLLAGELLKTGSLQREFLEKISSVEILRWLGSNELHKYALPLCEQLVSTSVSLLHSVHVVSALEQLKRLSPPHHHFLLWTCEAAMTSPEVGQANSQASQVSDIISSSSLAVLLSQWLGSAVVQEALQLYGGPEQLLQSLQVCLAALLVESSHQNGVWSTLGSSLMGRLESIVRMISAALHTHWDPDQVRSNIRKRKRKDSCALVLLRFSV